MEFPDGMLDCGSCRQEVTSDICSRHSTLRTLVSAHGRNLPSHWELTLCTEKKAYVSNSIHCQQVARNVPHLTFFKNENANITHMHPGTCIFSNSNFPAKIPGAAHLQTATKMFTGLRPRAGFTINGDDAMDLPAQPLMTPMIAMTRTKNLSRIFYTVES